jgi:PAS domain S-box-containing protein
MGKVGETSDARAADRMRQSEQRFQLLVESVVDYAIFMLDPKGIIETWNIGAERLKGYSAEEVVGRHYSTFYPDEDREAGLPERLLETARVRGRVGHSGWRVRKDGTRFWADVVITALHEEDGSLAGFAKVTRDMTESHQIEQARQRALAEQQRAVIALEELDQWRRDFISTVVHDLSSPVIAITGFAQMLLEEASPEQHEQRELVQRILSNTRSLEDLIDHLRTYSQLEYGRVQLASERIDLDEFVAELLGDLGPMTAEHRVEVDVAPVEVPADRRGLERILRNLIANAVHHTPKGSRILIRARRRRDAVTVEVSDEGDGIPQELLPRLFGRFERGKRGRTGLGLSIVKQYVELHGGEVSAESAPGGGATLRFTLPLEQDGGAADS